MKPAATWLALVFMPIIASCQQSKSADLGECDIECLEELALTGDIHAAEKLAGGRAGSADAAYWTGIAAQNGSARMAYEHALVLTMNSVQPECSRALYWSRKAALQGVAKAAVLAARLEEIEKVDAFECGCSMPLTDVPKRNTTCKTARIDLTKYLPYSRTAIYEVDWQPRD